MSFFTIRWDTISPDYHRKKNVTNETSIRVTCLDQTGKVHVFVKQYRHWIGVCTRDIDRVCSMFKRHFPVAEFRYTLLLKDCKKILPYFGERLRTGKLDYVNKPFYKVYVKGVSSLDVGRFFAKRYKIAYFDKSDWLCRLYLDVGARYHSSGFLYKWYEVDSTQSALFDAFTMVPEKVDPPQWFIAAFDLETVPMDGEERIPTGVHPTDRIVTISLVKWKTGTEDLPPKRYLLYLDPTPDDGIPFVLDGVKVLRYSKESSLLNDFHALVAPCQVLTGYNVDRFDLPCLFARLLWLGMYSHLKLYRSSQIGDSVVTTLQNKLVVDLYVYFSTFSNYDLPGFKLDDVARTKLKDTVKLPIKSTGIHAWYTAPIDSVQQLKHSDDVAVCHRVLRPRHVEEHQFGTFKLYLEYCMRDSDLVYQLFQKENVLSFLVERANFTTLNLVEALHLGNSRFILELFKSYGTLLGYFVNMRFFRNTMDQSDKYRSMFVDNGRTYQGALNYCRGRHMYEDVSVMDFTSMYPCALLSANLCYGTCDILSTQELASLEPRLLEKLEVIPYRNHSEKDFETTSFRMDKQFQYPTFDPSTDTFAIVIHRSTPGFLPNVVQHFLTQRKHHQALWKKTRHVFHDNAQLNIKILINSLYGVMANKDSVLSYLQIGIAIVTLARYQLLGSYHYLKRLGYEVCYADTDSLMVLGWPRDDCDQVNAYLSLPNVELKYEQRMKQLLVLSKKRYVYVTSNDRVVSKGFQKKVNQLVKFMSDKILTSTLSCYQSSTVVDSSAGWIVWVETLVQAYGMCRDPKKFTITRKAKAMKEYKSKSCPTYRMLEKHPERENGFIEYVFSRADVGAKYRSEWIMDVERVQYIDFEQLFMSQKKIFVDLLNVAFWKLPNPMPYCNMVLNTMRWKCFVHAELLHYLATGIRPVTMLVERGIKYTFKMNVHTQTRSKVVVRDVRPSDEEETRERKRKKTF